MVPIPHRIEADHRAKQKHRKNQCVRDTFMYFSVLGCLVLYCQRIVWVDLLCLFFVSCTETKILNDLLEICWLGVKKVCCVRFIFAVIHNTYPVENFGWSFDDFEGGFVVLMFDVVSFWGRV